MDFFQLCMRSVACGLTGWAISLLFSVINPSYPSAPNHKSSLKSISFQQIFVFPPLEALKTGFVLLTLCLSSLCLWGSRSTKCGSNYDSDKALAASWVTTLRLSQHVSAEYPFLSNTGASLLYPSWKHGAVTVASDPVTQFHQSVSWLWVFRTLTKFSAQ